MTLLDVAPGRAKRVDAARKGWIARLIDMSRRNQLLYYRPLATGTLELGGDAVEQLLAGQPVALGRLVEPDQLVSAVAKAREIRRRAVINREERGLETLFLARGLATWNPGDEGRPPAAPIMLVPVGIELQGQAGRNLILRKTGDTQLNPVLVHALEAEFGCRIDPELPQPAVPADADPDAALDPPDPAADFGRVAPWLAAQTARADGFAVHDALVLSNFAFQKMAMVRDLGQDADSLATHDVVAALAGDQAARDAVRASGGSLGGAPDGGPDGGPNIGLNGGLSGGPVDFAELDRTHPDDEHLFLDADATQQRAIMAVLAGRTGVIQGPPGTGKSQTIANLIAAFAARGKRVLFVAEKRAALDAVRKRLDTAGLGHLVLDLHGADIRRRQLLEQFAQSLEHVGRIGPVDGGAVHADFEGRRALLNAHVGRIHTPQPPSGSSVYALQGRLLRLPETAANPVRWRGPALDRLDAAASERIHALLAEAAGSAALFLHADPSPWVRSALGDGDAAIAAVDRAASIAARYWPAFGQGLVALVREAGFRPPASLHEAGRMVALCAAVAETLAKYHGTVFDGRAARLAAALAPAARGLLPGIWSWVADSGYRAALREASGLRVAGRASALQLQAELASAAMQDVAWRDFQAPRALASGSRQDAGAPRPLETGSPGVGLVDDVKPQAIFGAPGGAGVPPAPLAIASCSQNDAGAPRLPALLSTFQTQLSLLGRDIGRTDLETIPVPDLDALIKTLAADVHTPRRIPRLREIEAELSDLGLDDLVGYIRAHRIPAHLWQPAFENAWLTSCLDRAFAADSQLASFDGRRHDRTVAEFCDLDARRLQLASLRVMRLHAEHVVAALNTCADQADVVRGETRKRSRLASLRSLLERAPDVLTALRPCWMASPLSVSQLLPSGRAYFDVVLFDEASQVLPEDAVPALLRARQAVVAGDTRQLPPTVFFAAGEDESAGGAGTGNSADEPAAGFESILDQMAGFLAPWWLEWHYRSQDERLIAFSNQHIYGGRLVTFPGAGGTPPLQFEQVQSAGGADQEESVSAEVRRVVDLVLDHARLRPGESLGVITMGIKHMRRIEQELERALEDHPELEVFFDQQRADRFFVKNLERVQGDERDAIILSVGYGKGADGKLRYHFGPLLLQGGERRLNVAITRARKRTTVVASFDHHDMDPERTKAEGVRLLRLYLAYAASGGRDIGEGARAAVEQNAFEVAVHDALSRAGLNLIPQWGASRFRIDLVAKHPDRPGRLVLAIECDGATYHSAPTARDRDRLRQRQLEALGWRFHRIWSTDWFQRLDCEIARAVKAFEGAVAAADARDGESGIGDGEPAIGHGEPVIGDGEPVIGDGGKPVIGDGSGSTELPARARPLRPPVLRKDGIADYDDDELLAVIDWLMSDGLLRDNDTIVEQTIDELGFKRRTQKMRDRLEGLVAAWRSRQA